MLRHDGLVLGQSQATHVDLREATLVALCCLLSPVVSALSLLCPAVSPGTQGPLCGCPKGPNATCLP